MKIINICSAFIFIAAVIVSVLAYKTVGETMAVNDEVARYEVMAEEQQASILKWKTYQDESQYISGYFDNYDEISKLGIDNILKCAYTSSYTSSNKGLLPTGNVIFNRNQRNILYRTKNYDADVESIKTSENIEATFLYDPDSIEQVICINGIEQGMFEITNREKTLVYVCLLDNLKNFEAKYKTYNGDPDFSYEQWTIFMGTYIDLPIMYTNIDWLNK